MIEVRYFAAYREATGTASETLDTRAETAAGHFQRAFHQTKLDGRIYLKGDHPSGTFQTVRIIGHTDYDLIAEPA